MNSELLGSMQKFQNEPNPIDLQLTSVCMSEIQLKYTKKSTVRQRPEQGKGHCFCYFYSFLEISTQTKLLLYFIMSFKMIINLFVTSKKRNHEFMNSPIHEFKVLQNVF
jgi:hypothetical protein